MLGDGYTSTELMLAMERWDVVLGKDQAAISSTHFYHHLIISGMEKQNGTSGRLRLIAHLLRYDLKRPLKLFHLHQPQPLPQDLSVAIQQEEVRL